MPGDPDPRLIREAFADVSAAFLGFVDTVGDDDWARPATAEWTVRDLAAHAIRSFITLTDYEGTGDETITTASFQDYVTNALGGDPAVHAGVAARARATAAALGPDTAGAAHAAAAAADEQARRIADDHPINSIGGAIRYIDFLTGRIVELGLHLTDLQRALGRPLELPASVVALLRAELPPLLDRLDPFAVVLGLTGRGPLDVLG